MDNECYKVIVKNGSFLREATVKVLALLKYTETQPTQEKM